MPRNRAIVQGKSIEDILNMDIDTFNKLGLSDMKQVVGRLVSAGNKRLRSFEKRDETSPATRYIRRSGGAFTTKGKDLNALRAEYIRAKGFLQSQTGTIKGWKTTRKETIASLHDQGIDITVEQFDRFWRAYQDLKELDPNVATKSLKYTMLEEISNRVENTSKTPDEIATELHEQISKIYEQRAELKNEEGGVSRFFDV